MGLPELAVHLRQRNLTQGDIAARIGVSQQSVSQWLTGTRQPREAHQRALALLLGCTLAELQSQTGWQGRAQGRVNREVMPEDLAPSRPMISRESLVREVTGWLVARPPTHRLITLLGPPGIGKSYLATAAAAEFARAYGEQQVAIATFVDLPTGDPSTRVGREILAALGLAVDGARSPLARIADEINRRQRPFLLVLDAFEWVMTARSLIPELLERCFALRILVTSTEVLHLGDQQMRVPPLTFPILPRRLLRSQYAQPVLLRQVAAFLGPQASWETCGAIDLFVQRARAARPDVRIDAETLPAIAVICCQLQGVPLLIELVAAGARFTPDPRGLLADLGQVHRTVTSSDAVRQAAIARVYERLLPEEQALLRSLAIIPGVFGINDAAAWMLALEHGVMRLSGRDVARVSRNILRLVDAHLILQDTSTGQTLLLLDSIRAFALETLHASGEGEFTMRAFATWLKERAQVGESAFGLAHGGALLREISQLSEWFRLALAWSLAEYPAELGAPLAGSLWWYWDTRGWFDEGAYWLELARHQCVSGGSEIPGAVWLGIGVMAYRRREAAQADHALQCAMEAMRLADDGVGLRWATAYRGLAAEQLGDLARACTLHHACTELARAANDSFILAGSLSNEAEIALTQHRLKDAGGLLEESLALATSLGSTVLLGRIWQVCGRFSLRHDAFSDAGHAFTLALRYASQVEEERMIAVTLEGLATVEALVGETHRAARFFAAAEVLREESGFPRLVQHVAEYERGMHAAQASLPAPVFAAQWAAGEQRIRVALRDLVWPHGWAGVCEDVVASLMDDDPSGTPAQGAARPTAEQ
ncbi:MAG: helix-turn-helix domain-containing protein [Thermomicrobiales bacterium]